MESLRPKWSHALHVKNKGKQEEVHHSIPGSDPLNLQDSTMIEALKDFGEFHLKVDGFLSS